jgi:hypothetical protein
MAQLPHSLKRIRLNVARSKQFPEGSIRHGYEFVAPLDADGHIDAEMWRQYRDHCRVRRFWGSEEQIGQLVHKPGGKNTHDGCLTTTEPLKTTMRRGTDLGATSSAQENMCQFVMMKASFTRFR